MRLPASPLRLIGQFVVLAASVAFVAAFSDGPAYRQVPPGTGVVKFSFSHQADRSQECRRRTPEELAKLPPNMRRPMECPRARRPIFAELAIDGVVVFSEALPPSGFAKDGPSQVYRRFVVPAGRHAVTARLRDTPRVSGFDHERSETVTVAPGQSLALDFRPEHGGFVWR
jgi:hypothetical protein